MSRIVIADVVLLVVGLFTAWSSFVALDPKMLVAGIAAAGWAGRGLVDATVLWFNAERIA